MACAGDGIKPQFVGFAIGVVPFRNDANALAFDVFQLRLASSQIKGDVLNPADGTVGEQGIVFGHRAHERSLGLVGVNRNVGVGLLLRGARRHGFFRRFGSGFFGTGAGGGRWGGRNRIVLTCRNH